MEAHPRKDLQLSIRIEGSCSFLKIYTFGPWLWLAEWLLPTSEIRGSNPNIGKVFRMHVFVNCNSEKTKINFKVGCCRRKAVKNFRWLLQANRRPMTHSYAKNFVSSYFSKWLIKFSLPGQVSNKTQLGHKHSKCCFEPKTAPLTDNLVQCVG